MYFIEKRPRLPWNYSLGRGGDGGGLFSRITCLLTRMNPLSEGAPGNETQSKATVRSQRVSLESKRWATHVQLSEGSNCIQARRSCGCGFLHPERQGKENRRLRAG